MKYGPKCPIIDQLANNVNRKAAEGVASYQWLLSKLPIWQIPHVGWKLQKFSGYCVIKEGLLGQLFLHPSPFSGIFGQPLKCIFCGNYLLPKIEDD